MEVLEQRLFAADTKNDKCAACAEFCNGIFLPSAQEQGASFWCEKTPRNLLYADNIAEIYPDARFIHVIRDGRDVVSSILEKQFWPVARSARYPKTRKFCGEQTFDKVVNYWSTLIDIGLEQEALIDPSHWLNVCLEEVVDDPESSFDRIFNFIGVDNSIEILDEIRRYLKPSSSNKDRSLEKRLVG